MPSDLLRTLCCYIYGIQSVFWFIINPLYISRVLSGVWHMITLNSLLQCNMIVYIHSANVAFGDSFICALCVVPIGKACDKQESGSNCCACRRWCCCHLWPHAARSTQHATNALGYAWGKLCLNSFRMGPLNSDTAGMMFSSSDMFLMLQKKRLFAHTKSQVRVSYQVLQTQVYCV